MGQNHEAETAREAVQANEAETQKEFGKPGPFGIFAGVTPHPIIGVYELVPIPETQWK